MLATGFLQMPNECFKHGRRLSMIGSPFFALLVLVAAVSSVEVKLVHDTELNYFAVFRSFGKFQQSPLSASTPKQAKVY